MSAPIAEMSVGCATDSTPSLVSSFRTEFSPVQDINTPCAPDTDDEEPIFLSEITYNPHVDEFVQYSASSKLIPYDPKIHHERLVYNPDDWKIVPEMLRHDEDGSCRELTYPENYNQSCARVAWHWPVQDALVLHRFSKLPLELRRVIWKYTLPPPRIIRMWFEHGKFQIKAVGNPGSRFTQSSIKILHTCRESRTIFLENYHLLHNSSWEIYNIGVPENQFSRVHGPEEILENVNRKTMLGNNRDTLVLDIMSLQDIDLEEAIAQSACNFTKFKHIAFYGTSTYTPKMLQTVSEIVYHVRSHGGLFSAEFIVGATCFDDEYSYQHKLLKLDGNFIDYRWSYGYGPAPRLGHRERLLAEGENILSTLTAYVKTTKGKAAAWKDITPSASTHVRVEGPSYNEVRREINLIPRNPKYSGVYFNTIVVCGEDRPDLQRWMHSCELNAYVECDSNGTLVPSYDDYTGISNMLNDDYEPEKVSDWVEVGLENKLKHMLDLKGPKSFGRSFIDPDFYYDVDGRLVI